MIAPKNYNNPPGLSLFFALNPQALANELDGEVCRPVSHPPGAQVIWRIAGYAVIANPTNS